MRPGLWRNKMMLSIFIRRNCSMRTAGSTLYMNKPLSLRKATEKNLCQKLSVLGVNEGAEVYVTSEKLQLPLVVRISKP